MLRTALICIVLVTAASAALAEPAARLVAPPGRAIKVAFVVTDSANVMDLAGPWEAFQDAGVATSGTAGEGNPPFELYVVSETKAPVEMTAGMNILPHYTFADAPAPDIVVVGAQKGSDSLVPWLRAQYAQGHIIMSVCTGAFKLAAAGLLDGKRATTHHEYFKSFAERFPKVTLVPGNRFVQSDARIYTAGGLTSGVDLALHIIALYFGDEAAARTANYMEYSGQGWRQPEGASPTGT